VIPSDWRVLRGLLKLLGLGALAALTLGVLSDPPWVRGPVPLAVALYVGSPLVVVVAAIAVRRRWPPLRVPAALVAGLAAVAFVANLGLVLFVHRTANELAHAMGRTCRSIPKCRDLAADKFGAPHPLMPGASLDTDYAFRSGSESGNLLMLSYGQQGSDERTIVFVVTERRPTGFEPPADDSDFTRTRGGTAFVETRVGGRVTRLDWWDASFHYAVSLQGSYERSSIEYERATQLIDSARLF
jgi:hypothetical protein